MNDDIKLIELVEHEVLSFDKVSRFADATLSENIQAVFGRDLPNPGIRITEDDDKLVINLEIIVYYGTNIPQLCYDIQTRLKHYIEETSGTEVKAVNIRIEGIDKTEDK